MEDIYTTYDNIEYIIIYYSLKTDRNNVIKFCNIFLYVYVLRMYAKDYDDINGLL